MQPCKTSKWRTDEKEATYFEIAKQVWKYKNKVIDEQVEAIKGVAPDIVIIEV